VFDDAYRGFFELAATHVATAVSNARALELERARAEKLAELDRAKMAFFSNISHDLSCAILSRDNEEGGAH
jgi:GAF domain-containing protein